MKFSQGHHVLRITLRSVANFGSTGGTVAVDRPVAVDPWTQLPFIAESIPRGVLAGAAFGNVSDKSHTNGARDAVFGSPDDDRDMGPFQAGRPAALTFGDAVLLSFPTFGRDGSVVHVFPASTLRLLADLPLSTPLAATFVLLEADQCTGKVSAGALPDCVSATVASHSTDVRRLAGLGDSVPYLIVGDRLAHKLWQSSIEDRTQTAIAGDTNRALRGSLRRVEYIPESSVFVSLVSNDSGGDLNLDVRGHIQLGAWEGTGAGFVRLDWLEPDAETAALSVASVQQLDTDARERHLMLRARQAIIACQGKTFASPARSLIRDFGTRWITQGLPQSLAFVIAKAGCMTALPTDKRSTAQDIAIAHRWLLSALLEQPAHDLCAPQPELLKAGTETITGQAKMPPHTHRYLDWLRRYAEHLMVTDDEGVTP